MFYRKSSRVVFALCFTVLLSPFYSYSKNFADRLAGSSPSIAEKSLAVENGSDVVEVLSGYLSDNLDVVITKLNKELKKQRTFMEGVHGHLGREVWPKVSFEKRSNFFYEGLRVSNLIDLIVNSHQKNIVNFKKTKLFLSRLVNLYNLLLRKFIVNFNFSKVESLDKATQSNSIRELQEAGDRVKAGTLSLFFRVFACDNSSDELLIFRARVAQMIISVLRAGSPRGSDGGRWTDEDKKEFLGKKIDQSKLELQKMYGQLGNKVGAYGLPSSDEMCAAIEILRHVVEPKRKFPWGKAAKVVGIAAGTVAGVYLISWVAGQIRAAASSLGSKAAQEIHGAAREVGMEALGGGNGKKDPLLVEFGLDKKASRIERYMGRGFANGLANGGLVGGVGLTGAVLTGFGLAGLVTPVAGPLMITLAIILKSYLIGDSPGSDSSGDD